MLGYDYDSKGARGLSDIGIIYYGKAGYGQVYRSFWLNGYGFTLRFALPSNDRKICFKTSFPRYDRLSPTGYQGASLKRHSNRAVA